MKTRNKIFSFVATLILNISFVNSAFSQELSIVTASKSEISKAMKEARDTFAEVFMVSNSGVLITGKEWKLKEHSGSKKPIEMYIDGKYLILDSIIAFQSPYGRAERIGFEPKKSFISDVFAYYVTKNADYSLLYRELVVRNGYSSKNGNEVKTKDDFLISHPGTVEPVTEWLLKQLSDSNTNAKAVYDKYNGKVDRTLARLIEFITACNLK